MTDHFNNLSPAQAERLAMLAEECGEVIQIVGKILRHGYDSHHPASPHVTNRELLGDELTDLMAVSASLSRDKVPEGSLWDQDRAWEKKLRYAHHQEELRAALDVQPLSPTLVAFSLTPDLVINDPRVAALVEALECVRDCTQPQCAHLSALARAALAAAKGGAA